MSMELVDCDNVIIEMCGMKEVTRDMLAETYAMAIVSSWPTDWKAVNAAITKRWPKGLEYIKGKAWKIILAHQQAAKEAAAKAALNN